MNITRFLKLLFSLFTIIILALLTQICSSKHEILDNDFHFILMTEDQTGIDFNNKLAENDSINFLTNQYICICSGVGVANFNNDGLQDIFCAGEQVSCKLYISKGGFKFEDVTDKTGMCTSKGCTGVNIVDTSGDLDNDGDMVMVIDT